MSIRTLRLIGDPVLRTASDPVTRFDDALARLVEDLLDTVREPGRAGLAANQIGSSLAAFSYNVDGQFGYLINPRIVELSGSQDGLEGCLSLPGLWAERIRPAYVIAEGVNLGQEPVMVAGTGGLARCLQHETDHLRGELFIDGLAGEERRRILRQLHREQITGAGPAAGQAPDQPQAPSSRLGTPIIRAAPGHQGSARRHRTSRGGIRPCHPA
jgi:peptide deformylase